MILKTLKSVLYASGFLTALGLTPFTAGASAETVRMLHIINEVPLVEYLNELELAYEAQHPDIDVDLEFLENEAFKAKLPTLLQSGARPDIFYSWGGGVFQAQAQAGVLRDITEQMRGEWEDTLSPAGVEAFTYEGKVYGVPWFVSQVGFWYNKKLTGQAGVDVEAIKTWDDFLEAVEKLKAAGITPVIAGGKDKWPLHFYWSYLALRIGGKTAFEAAVRGEGDGFASETFVRAGEEFKRLIDLEPFQQGFMAAAYDTAAGQFYDGEGAFHLMGNWDYHNKQFSESGLGIPDEELGFISFPMVAGGQGNPSDTLGGINGWLVAKGASEAAVDWLKFLLKPEHQRIAGARGLFIPIAKGVAGDIENPFFRQIAENIAASEYHQIFYDQALGPSVGAVVNDISVSLATGAITPHEAAAAVQEAWEWEIQ